MTATTDPAGITVAEGSNPERSHALAATLGAGFAIPVTSVRVDDPPVASASQTAEEALAEAIASRVPADHLLVVESRHADRWRSRHSIAEHLIDAHRSATVVLGPSSGSDLASGPIIVALDGSADAQTSLSAAQRLGEVTARPLLLVRVVAEPLDPDDSDHVSTTAVQLDAEAAALGATAIVAASNDPVTALVRLGAEQHAACIALASSGDREAKRSTMSRTAAGLIAEATCPIYVTRSVPR